MKIVKEVKAEFTEKDMTRNAGLVHIGRFMKKLSLKKLLKEHLSVPRGANTVYETADMAIILLLAAVAGAKHMSHLSIIRTDQVIRKIFGWKERFPDDTTSGRIFKLFTHAHCQEISEVEDRVRRKIWGKRFFGRITLDFDSSVRSVYGSQEGAEKGYNPKNRGKKSYHPLFCFIAETRECLNNWFRCGSAYSANGIVEFAKECFQRLPARVWLVTVRCDSAFFNGEFMDFLEEKGALYIIKVKMKNLVKLLESKKWTPVKNRPGFETTEFKYECGEWSQARRFVAVREKVEVMKKGELVTEYKYFCYVTNDRRLLTPMDAHKKYGKRATSENWIEWCKNQMAAGSILTKDFWANSAIFQLYVMAYNLMVWMSLLTKGHPINEEPNTIRFGLIHVPGRLLTSGRQLVLKLSKNWWFKNRWIEVEKAMYGMVFT